MDDNSEFKSEYKDFVIHLVEHSRYEFQIVVYNSEEDEMRQSEVLPNDRDLCLQAAKSYIDSLVPSPSLKS